MQQLPLPLALALLPLAEGAAAPQPLPPQPLFQLPLPISMAAAQLYWAFYANPAANPYNRNYQDALAYFCLIAGINTTPQVAGNHIYHAATRNLWP